VKDSGFIEDSLDSMQVIFSNSFVGGHVFDSDCSQQEIIFLCFPEMICSRLFTYQLLENEAFYIEGVERFSKSKFSGNKFQFDSDVVDTNIAKNNQFKNHFIAMDAFLFSEIQNSIQWEQKYLERELYKSFIGFSKNYSGKVSTGKWGCGFAKGDKELKFMIQWIASSKCNQKMVFYTFNDLEFKKRIDLVVGEVMKKKMEIQEIYKFILQFKNKEESLFDWMSSQFSK
jgi:hypothetical protein